MVVLCRRVCQGGRQAGIPSTRDESSGSLRVGGAEAWTEYPSAPALKPLDLMHALLIPSPNITIARARIPSGTLYVFRVGHARFLLNPVDCIASGRPKDLENRLTAFFVSGEFAGGGGGGGADASPSGFWAYTA